MKEKKLNNTENEKSQLKKKSGALKIVVIIIIVIMAIIIGILSWLLISGKDFSNIFSNIEQSESRKEDKKVDTENQNIENNSNNDEKNKEKKEYVSGKGSDDVSNNTNLKDSFKVTYETRGVRNITIEGSSFVCNENVPHITGISENAAKNMEKYLNDWYSRVWKDIDEQTKDDYIKELLNQMNENSKKYDYAPEDIGFNQSYNVIYLTNKLVTFEYVFQGGLGGVSWGNTSGVSFDLETGNVIEINNLVTSKEKYIETCKKSAFEQLKKDSRYNEVIEMHKDDYESIINSAIEKLDGYFTKDGIVFAEIPKYSIASGASGEFKFVISYDLIKEYIDNKYIESSNGNAQVNEKENYTTDELEKMALDYYETKTGYRPGNVASQVNQDGTVSIQLYDNMGDHNSTSDWYTVDSKTAVGTNVMGDKIDLKK